MNTLYPRSGRRAQRGVGALVITLLLLFSASVGILFVNRSVLFEQRASGNQMQATRAQEVAEAGLEWVVGMLNSPTKIGVNCTADGAGKSFRTRYVQTHADDATPSLDVAPATTMFPGCKTDPDSGATTCGCPTSAGTASVGSAVLPSFTAAFEAVAGDVDAVKVTVYACSAKSAACDKDNFSLASTDGNARISALLKLKPVLRAAPAAPLTCGTSCTVGGSFNIINTDVATNGALVDAGTAISTAPGTTLETIPGLPGANALIQDDASLANLSSADPTCENSAMFNAYFGSTLEQYKNASTTKILSCGSAADCKSKLDAAYAANWRNFYFESDFQLSGNNTYGTPTDPITLVTPNALKINGTNTFYGLIFSNSSDWNDIGTGTADIFGAQITCAAYKTNGNGTISYDPSVLANAQRRTALMLRVPGSWRDFKVNTDNLP